ncbi:hypothetical protein BSK59_16310 [Paenibacillus odorifer]|uniref:hypothetical protein n=1 Tax=Paenibacillus odorifer TaxID=189426 RepID=UPI00096E78FA|nr:hypothetical protein [Paenibacillus odorifer]OME54142.1 hypothetical protein BSK59_16310 [Paenibacillus odorifer]
MEVVVRYSDFSEVIKEVQIPIDADRRNVISIESTTNVVQNEEVRTDIVKLESIDESVSFSVIQTMSKSDLRDYVQLLQKILVQMK